MTDKKVWNGAEQLRQYLVPLASLTRDPENVRLHNERNITALRQSLEKFGQVKPIITRKSVIVAGNATHETLTEMGFTHIAVVDMPHLTDMEAKVLAIADNKVPELAEWDFQKLGEVVRDMDPDLRKLTGFLEYELEPLLKANWAPPDEQPLDNIFKPKRAVEFTEEQWIIVTGAIAHVRQAQDGPVEATDGRCLELICADYLAGH